MTDYVLKEILGNYEYNVTWYEMFTTRFHESWITNFHEYSSQSERVLFACFLKPSRLILIGQRIEENFGISDWDFVKPCVVSNFIILKNPAHSAPPK